MKVKIYTLKDPNTLEIRYIGRTKNSLKVRLSGHCCKAKQNKFKTYKDNWILSLGCKPIIELLEEVTGWEESYKREQILIKEYLGKGFKLTNLHDRGSGGLLRDISQEQKEKISKKVKQLHDEGKLSCGRKPVDLYDLEGTFIRSFISYSECATYIQVSNKHLENYMKRGDKRLRNYQIVPKDAPNPGKYINPRIIRNQNARLKLGELLENLETDNQQPS